MAFIKNTDALIEGLSNKFFTNERAKAAVQSDLDNLQNQIDDVLSNIDPAALDSLTEIVAAFQSGDNSLDARLDALEADSVTKAYVDSADNALDARLDIIEGADSVEGSVAKAEKDAKDYADSLNSAEQSARESADNALDARLDIIEGADSVEGSVAKAEKDAKDYTDAEVAAEESARIAAVSAEQSARESADNALDARLDIIEGADSVEGSVAKAEKDAKDYTDAQVAALVNSAPAVLDTLKELADALGNDENFSTTISGQIGGLDARLDIIEGADSVEGSVAKAEKDAKDYTDAEVSAEEAARIAAVSAEESARIVAVSAEESARISADNALDARLDIIEGADSVEGSVAKAEKDAKDYADSLNSAEQSARESADNALDARLDIIEGADSVEGSVAKAEKDAKDYADSLNSAEQSARESADNALDARLDIIEGADSVEGSVAKAEKDAKDYADSLNSAEQSARESADNALDARLDIIEGADTVEGSVAKAEKDAKDYADAQIAALVNSAPAVLDTLKELSDALGGDANFATTISGQIGGLDARLDTLEGADTVEGSVAKAEKDAKDYTDAEVAAEEAARIAAVSAEESARISADNALDARLDIIEGADSVEGSVAKAEKDAKDYADSLNSAEQSARAAAVSAEESARIAADNALDARLDVLEADPVTKAYVDAEDLTMFKKDGSRNMTGNILFNSDGVNNIGNSAANRPDNIYVKNSLVSAGSIQNSSYSGSKALVSDGSKNLVESVVTSTELGYLSGLSSGVQSQLDNKVNVTANYDIKPQLYNGGSKSSSFTADFANGPAQKFTLQGNVSISFQNPVTGGSYMFQLVQDGTGNRQLSWPIGIVWTNGAAPVLSSSANAIDFVQLWYDGSTYYGDYQIANTTYATSAQLTAEETARIAEDLTFFKLDGSRAITGSVEFQAGLKIKRTAVSANYTVLSTDYYVGVTNLSSTRTITLPSAATVGAGKLIHVKDESGNASVSTYIRVQCDGSETVQGDSYYDITVPYEGIELVSTGSGWMIK